MNSDFKFKVTIHPHALIANNMPNTWLCNGTITPPKNECKRHHKKGEFKLRDHQKYSCEVHNMDDCNFDLCDLCTQKYMVSSPIAILTTKHEHPLAYYKVLPTRWFCDALPECSTNHAKNLAYRNAPIYICLKCGFCLCETDAKKFEIRSEVREEIPKKANSELKAGSSFGRGESFLG